MIGITYANGNGIFKKCNGIRPACDSCTSMNRTSECKYDDSSRKSHTRKLLEHQEALEARLRELESERRNSRPSTSSTTLPIEAPTPTVLPQSSAWGFFDALSSTPLPSMDPLWDFQVRPSSTSSTTLSDRSVSIPLGLPYDTNLPTVPSMAFTKPSTHDRTPDRILHESVTLSVEMHNSLYVFPFPYLALFSYDDLMIESKYSSSTESNAVSTPMSAVSTHHHQPPYSKIRHPVPHS